MGLFDIFKGKGNGQSTGGSLGAQAGGNPFAKQEGMLDDYTWLEEM